MYEQGDIVISLLQNHDCSYEGYSNCQEIYSGVEETWYVQRGYGEYFWLPDFHKPADVSFEN